MNRSKLFISVIIPFYNGNRFVMELLNNLSQVQKNISSKYNVNIEVVMVNDSPEVEIEYNLLTNIDIKVIKNEKNVGIHASRVNGLRHASGDWIIFLDQDDFLIPEKYITQLDNLEDEDVIVGNGYYYTKGNRKLIFSNKRSMEYLIREKTLVGIRNLIPSPGECLIKKSCIPNYWIDNTLIFNGADDWMLWLLLFNSKVKFKVNESVVYIHRSTDNGNLSFDLDKMLLSCNEMLRILKKNKAYSTNKCEILKRAINFKYLLDVRKITLYDFVRYYDRFIANIIYKIHLELYKYAK